MTRGTGRLRVPDDDADRGDGRAADRHLDERAGQPHGLVTDLDARVDAGSALRAARSAGMVPEQAGVVVSGLCARCSKSAA